MGTHYQGTRIEEQALDAFIKLQRAAQSVTTAGHGLFTAEGITDSQFGILEVLLHLGPQRQGVLATKLLKSEANITFVLDRLEEQGLVERRPDPDDRRARRVVLTPGGRKRIQAVFPAHVRSLTKIMSILSEPELVELGRLCRKLGHHAEGVTA